MFSMSNMNNSNSSSGGSEEEEQQEEEEDDFVTSGASNRSPVFARLPSNEFDNDISSGTTTTNINNASTFTATPTTDGRGSSSSGSHDNNNNNNNNPSSSSSQPPIMMMNGVRFRRAYKGGFSTSICDLFQNPKKSRSDFCAIACCGICLQDRNQYILSQYRQPLNNGEDMMLYEGVNWTRRLLINVVGGIPLAFVSILFFHNIWLVPMLVLGIRASMIRSRFRRRLMMEMQFRNGTNSDTSSSDFIMQANRPHWICFGMEKDLIFVEDTTTTTTTTGTNSTTTNETASSSSVVNIRGAPSISSSTNHNGAVNVNADLCTWIWGFVRDSCCGALFGCWMQCCGICAIAQEDRELQRMYANQNNDNNNNSNDEIFQMDYVTFQPFSDYYPKIRHLRATRNVNWDAHYKGLSQLSVRLVTYFTRALIILTIAAVLHLTVTFKVSNMIVLVATLAQGMGVLYFVHWKYHRLDLSLDAVIKLFAAGFICGAPTVTVIEMILSTIANIIFGFIFAVEYEEDQEQQGNSNIFQPDNDNGLEIVDPAQLLYDVAENHLWSVLALYFFNAYIVAGLTEELTKYFCFWMVEHPDFVLNDAAQNAGNNNNNNNNYQRGLHSRAAAITVGMVATASGFACLENIEYCFSASSASSQFEILLARVLLPIHLITAAIQSVGIIRRDIEGDKRFQLGRAIFPAILLHGTFDFALIVLSVFNFINEGPPPEAGEQSSQEDSAAPVITFHDIFPSLVIGLPIAAIGVAYYLYEAREQRERLYALASISGNVVWVAGNAQYDERNNIMAHHDLELT